MQVLESESGERFRAIEAVLEDEDDLARGWRLLCANCGHAVTNQDARIAVNGATEHNVVNPAGTTFHIGCFATVPRCQTAGAATGEFSWFPGYAWRVLYCGGCATHLGWRFDAAASDRFFALILQRLIAEN